MFFFCRPKTVVLDAFIDDPNIASMLPPSSATNHRPKWWGKIASDKSIISDNGLVFSESTIKRCRGFKDYYSDRAIILPLWTSFILDFDLSSYRYVFPNDYSKIIYQPDESRGTEYLKGYHHFKLISPWKFKETLGINFLFSQPFYNFEDPNKLIVPPGVVNYKYQNATHFNFFVKCPTNGSETQVSFDAGQPFVHLTPMTDKKVDVRVHVVSEKELSQIGMPQIFFTSAYKKIKQLGYGKNV